MRPICTICVHPQRATIEQMLASDDSYRAIARQFGVGRDPLARHYAKHLATVPLAQAAAPPIVAAPVSAPVADVDHHDARLLGRLGLCCSCGADDWEELAGAYQCHHCGAPLPATPTCPHSLPARGSYYPIACEQCGHAWTVTPPLVAPLRDPWLSDRCRACNLYGPWRKDFTSGKWTHECGATWTGISA